MYPTHVKVHCLVAFLIDLTYNFDKIAHYVTGLVLDILERYAQLNMTLVDQPCYFALLFIFERDSHCPILHQKRSP